MAAQSPGSKGVIGDASSLLLMGECLLRLLLYHIDQTYKSLRGPFFGLVQKNHICFGYLQHRSQCCDTSRGDSMPMTEIEYAPIPEIPLVLLHREKPSFTVEEVLRAGLQVTLKVRSPQGPFDLVCLRLRSYMPQTDPILQDVEVKRRLEALRAGVTTAQAARDSARLQVLVESANDTVHGNLSAALGVIEATAQTVDQQQDHSVMHWCTDKGWLNDEEHQWLLLAMIQRGLITHLSGSCFSCVHHDKQLWGFGECVRHFTEVRTFHLHEQPHLQDFAENLKRSHTDEITGGSSVLERYFGHAAVKLIFGMGWQLGQRLGYNPAFLLAENCIYQTLTRVFYFLLHCLCLYLEEKCLSRPLPLKDLLAYEVF